MYFKFVGYSTRRNTKATRLLYHDWIWLELIYGPSFIHNWEWLEIIWLISIYHYVASDRLSFSWCSNWWEVMMTSLSLCHVMVYNNNPINSCQLTRLWQFYQLALNFLFKINKVKLCFCKTNLKTWMNVFKIWYHFLSAERKVLRDFKNMFFLL